MDRAVLLNEPGEPARVEEVTLEEPAEDEVVVRMLAVGVCHSDLYVKETDGWNMRFPIPQPSWPSAIGKRMFQPSVSFT